MHTSSGEVRMRSTLLTPSGKRNLKNFGSDADKVIVRFSSILIKKKLSAKIIKSILTANSKWDVFKTIKRTMKVKGNSLSKKVLNHSHTSIKLNILILRCRNSQEEVFFLSILFIRVFWAKSPTHTDVPLSFHSIEI